VLAKYPDIKVGRLLQTAIMRLDRNSPVSRRLLAANPKIDGIMTQGYGSGAIQALKDAGRSIVPVVGFSYNVAAVTCAQTQGAKCILGSNPAYLSSEAIKLAVDILDTGKKPAERSPSRSKEISSPRNPFDSKLYPGTKMIKIAVGENALPRPGARPDRLPITPDWVEITAAEAAGSK